MAYFRPRDALRAIRSGAWLTAERARGYSVLLLAIATAGLLAWIALSHHMVDRNGKPLGTDFSSFYAAGALAREGQAAGAYDPQLHHARQQQTFGAATPYYAWQYPPVFLLVAAPLAALPYPVALALWQGVTLVLYLMVIRRIVRPVRPAAGRLWLLTAAAFPAVFINLGHGQNGFLTAALLGGGALLLTHRPLLAGVLFGLLAYKPQFALVIPVALVAGGYWRSVMAATLTVAALAAVTTALFGVAPWQAFIASMEASRRVLLEAGDVGFEKLQSAFAAVRLLGGGVALAYAVQAIVSGAVIVSVGWAFRVLRDDTEKAALLLAATLLASPHVLDYDLMVLGPTIAFAVATGLSRGFRPYEISLLAAAWTVPLLARAVAGVSTIPLGVLVVGALYILLLRHAVADRDGAALCNQRMANA
ncbi:glycosyltransferase family 87 protein [Bradyrhizobium sp. 2TAF24]|uniref:glycosyltransferase family 87 protein n=1 Tax=Bradyrhizobium sp. 2TAF24 TaxID=3233011 RepID=UPI003F8E529E